MSVETQTPGPWTSAWSSYTVKPQRAQFKSYQRNKNRSKISKIQLEMSESELVRRRKITSSENVDSAAMASSTGTAISVNAAENRWEMRSDWKLKRWRSLEEAQSPHCGGGSDGNGEVGSEFAGEFWWERERESGESFSEICLKRTGEWGSGY